MKSKNTFDYIDKITYSKGCKICTREVFESMLDNGDIQRNCEAVVQIRNQETPGMSDEERRNIKDHASNIKKELKAIVPHGHSTTGERKNECMTPSPWCSMDIDNVENPREYFETLTPLLELLHCPLAFVSPSGRGLKLLLPMVEGMDRKQAQKYFADVLHLESYDSTPDLARCCFMVPRKNLLIYKPEELFAEEVELLPNPNGGAGAIVPYEEVEPPVIEDAEIIEEPDQPAEESAEADPNAEPTYHGIPVSRIIEAYWIVNNEGNTPSHGERNDLTYELALGVRHICDYNRDIMLRVIPCYDGLPDAERISCIDSALKRPRSKMPEKMLNTLNYLRKRERDNMEFQQSLLDIEEVDNSFYISQIRTSFAQPTSRVRGLPLRERGKLPAGLRETLEPFPDSKAMPVIVAMGTMIGVLANNVRLIIRDEDPKALNLQCFIVGPSGSGKSQIDRVDQIWMKTWREKQEVHIKKERVYEEQRRLKRNAKDQPKDPKARILELSPRTSTSMIVVRLENADGNMCYTFMQEADMATANGGQTFNKDLSVIQRCQFDESSYSTAYMNTDTGYRFIPHVRWNIVKCGTPDALYRSQLRVLDGEITRLAIASMPDNTFAPLEDKPPVLTDRQRERIQQIAHLLDEVMASQRMRIPITAERICCALMLAQYARWLVAQLDERKGELPKWAGGCTTAEDYLKAHPNVLGEHLTKFQTAGWCTMMDCLCDYLHEQVLLYFRSRLERARASEDHVVQSSCRRSNDSIYDQLPQEFTDADLIKSKDGNKEAARSMRRRWLKHGMIRMSEAQGRYVKCS